MQSVTSNAVYKAVHFYEKRVDFSSQGWYKICSVSYRNYAFFLKLLLAHVYQNNPAETKEINIAYNWRNYTYSEMGCVSNLIHTKLAIAYNENNADYVGVYLYYNYVNPNPCFFSVMYCGTRFMWDFKKENPTDAYSVVQEKALNSSGMYYNNVSVV